MDIQAGMRDTMSLAKKFNKLQIIVAVCVMICFMVNVSTVTAFASKTVGITDEFDGLEGDGKYFSQEYRDNYQLDIEKLGIKDAGYGMLNAISNGIFSAITFVGLASISVFYYALDFDIAALLEPMISSIQSSIRLNVFLPIFQLILVGAFILAIIRFARRDFSGLMGQFGKVIFVLLMSVLLVHDSATFLSYTSNITKSLSVQIMTGVSGVDMESGTSEYAATAAGVLWVSLVHEPWKSLEFAGYDYSDEDVEFFLTETDEDTRNNKVQEIREDNPKAFSKSTAGQRIGQGAIMFLTMLFKCIVYILIAVILLLFQVFTIIMVLLAPIILLMALMPGYDFMILGAWCRKMLEIQVGILVVTFLMGIMVLMDQLIQGMSYIIGWYIAVILQVAMCIGLYFFRYEVLGILSMATMMGNNPRRMMRTKFGYMENPYRYMARMNRGTQGWRGIKRFVAKARYKNQEEYSEKFSRYSESPHKERMDNRGRTERPSTYQTSVIKKREGIQSHSRPPEPKLETTGIKSMSYYAPREITDNWRELWDKAEKPGRPKMEENIRRKKNESSEPMSRPDSLNGSNPEMREEDGASKASVNRPVSYQPESREQPGKKRDVVVEKPTKVQERPVSYHRVQEGGERTEPTGESNQRPSEQTERTSTRPISHQVISKDVQKDLPAADENKSLKDVPERPISHLSISQVKEKGEAIEGAEQGTVVQQRPISQQTTTTEKRKHLEGEHTRKQDKVVHSRHPDKLQGRLKNVGKNKVTADAMESTDNPSSRPMSQSVRTEEGKTEEFKSGKMEPGRNT